MDFIIKTHGGDMISIDETTKNEILQSIKDGNKTFGLGDTGEIVSLNPVPTILSADRVRVQDADHLSQRGMRRCEYGTVHKLEERCECFNKAGRALPWEDLKFRPLLSGVAREDLKKWMERSLGAKTFSEPSYDEILQSRADGGERRAQAILKN